MKHSKTFMLRIFIGFFVFVGLVIALSGSVRAEPYRSFLAGPHYNKMVQQLTTRGFKEFNFGEFRMNYVGTQQYDPLGEETRQKVLNLAYVVQNETEPEKQAQALDQYNALVKKHLAHMGVVAQALSLARQDSQFGDPKFLLQIRSGLLQEVLNSGDGWSLYGAYDVITLAEETALLSYLNVEVMHTETVHLSSVYYNMHSVVDRKTGDPKTVFVDLLQPLSFLEEQRGGADEPLTRPQW